MEPTSETPKSRPGLLLVLEGIDGAGKTTQVRLLAEIFHRLGEDVVVSKEPTRGPWGQKIRESARYGRLPLSDELDAFLQDRRQHVHELIAPALARGAVVILDRYFYSTIAYQGSRGADVASLAERMKEFPRPATVFVLDVDPVVGRDRVSRRDGAPNLFEDIEQLSAARRIFNQMNSRITVPIRGEEPVATVHRRIVEHLVSKDGPLRDRPSLRTKLAAETGLD